MSARQSPPARVLVVSHTYTLEHNRAKLAHMRAQLRARGGDLAALVPDRILEPWGEIRAEDGEALFAHPARPLRRNTLRLFAPGWTRALDAFRPTHVHVEEEPFSLLTAQTGREAVRRGLRFSFFSWENLDRRLPPPARAAEFLAAWWAHRAVAGSEGAKARLAIRMPGALIAVAPQLGATLPERTREHRPGPLRVLFAGRLEPEKGVLDLQAAARRLDGVRFTAIGPGPLRDLDPVRVLEPRPHEETAALMLDHDVLVLPSRTTPRWSEQFGRVLIEAMAGGLVAVGSSSGAIPEVVGDPSLVFPEGEVDALTALLDRLRDPDLRATLGARARARAEALYSDEAVATRTLEAIGALGPAPAAVLTGTSPAERWPSMEVYFGELSRALAGRVDLLRTPGPPPRSAPARAARRLLDRYLLMPRAVRRIRGQVVHVHDNSYAHLLAAARVPTVVTVHDLLPLRDPRRSLGSWLYRRATRRLPLATRVLIDSVATRTDVAALGVDPTRITAVPLGVSSAFHTVTRGAAGDHVRLLYVGTTHAHKRIDLYAAACIALARRGRSVVAAKAGWPLPPVLRALLEDAGVAVEDLGAISQAGLLQAYATSTALLHTSEAEGFGLTVAEAMAAGLPVVATGVPALRDLTGGDAALLVTEDGGPQQFADAVELLLDQPDLAARLVARGRERARALTWEATAAQTLAVYLAVEQEIGG